MARLTMERFMQLQEMGREPISLPASIFFGGNEVLQKTPGNHHLPQFRKSGTFNHPSLRAWRKRVAMDRAKRLINNKMSEVELRKCGGIAGLQKALEEFGLAIDADQKEVALMNANALEMDGKAKREMHESQKIIEMAKLGIKYTPIPEDTTKPVDVVKATIRAQKTKVAAEDDLSSLKDESEKDKNQLSREEEVAAGTTSGVVDTGEDVDVKFVGKD